MDKSHVTMEQKVCIVCDKDFDTGTILLDKHLKQRFERHTRTGVGLCPACKKDGYLTLIEVDPTKSIVNGSHAKPEDVYKTGVVVHVRNEFFMKLFDCSPPPHGFAFIDPELTQRLSEMMSKTKEE